MNELQVFENPAFGQVRTVTKDGEPWFVAADVCRALAHSNPTMAVRGLDDDERMTLNFAEARDGSGMTLNFADPRATGTRGGAQSIVIINEPGLYQLVIRSNKPEAKNFKRWITHEVIPSIRKHGAYATGETIDRIIADPDFGIRLLDQLKQEREARLALETQTKEDAPKVLFAKSVECSNSEILVGELAKILKQNGADFGPNRLFERLRQDGYLISRKGSDWNMPTQKSMDLGVMRIKETTVTHADGHVIVSKTPKITGKGQIYFVNRYAVSN